MFEEKVIVPNGKSEQEVFLLKDFMRQLSDSMDIKNLSIERTDETYEIEAEKFTLTFTISDSIFEIRSIDARGNTGYSSKIIAAIHDYSDTNDLEVIASNVIDTAQGFWENMGYIEAEVAGEYFRVT